MYGLEGLPRELLLAVLASGLPDWNDPRAGRARVLAAARAELVGRYPCDDCGAEAGRECRPDYGCADRSRRPASRLRRELVEPWTFQGSEDSRPRPFPRELEELEARAGYCSCESPVMDPEHDAGCRRCGLPVDFSPARGRS